MPCCKTRRSPSAIRGCSRAAIEKDQRNQPRPWAGAFAVVYKALSPDDRRPFAVRVFTSESPERRERYELVAAYAKDHKPRCLVEFEYRDQSIRSAGDGKWYPVILMEWVQGETMFNWVRDRCREGNADAIGFVADRWVDAVKELADAAIAHGDLQHGNVMVTPRQRDQAGRLRLHVRAGVGRAAQSGSGRRALPASQPRTPRRCCRWTWTTSRRC